MKVTRTFLLERKAASSGGDRYKEKVEPSEEPIMGSTYVNQSISRGGKRDRAPAPALQITIETGECA